jgi:hypothetical protein
MIFGENEVAQSNGDILGYFCLSKSIIYRHIQNMVCFRYFLVSKMV